MTNMLRETMKKVYMSAEYASVLVMIRLSIYGKVEKMYIAVIKAINNIYLSG